MDTNTDHLTEAQKTYIRYEPLEKYAHSREYLGRRRYCRVTFEPVIISHDPLGNVVLTRAEKAALKQNPKYFEMSHEVANQLRKMSENAKREKEDYQEKTLIATCEKWDKKPITQRWKAIGYCRHIPQDGKAIHIFIELDDPMLCFAYVYYDGYQYSNPVAYTYKQMNLKTANLINLGCDVFLYRDETVLRYNHGSKMRRKTLPEN